METRQTIFGEPEVIKRAEDAGPGDKIVYVNMDAIRQVPDGFEIVFSEVKFNPNDLEANFSPVGGGMLMPKTDLMYAIGEARGISGVGSAKVEPVYEIINRSDIEMKEAAEMVKIKVGYQCAKISEVTEEDGRQRKSSQCTILYNAFDRCMELWTKEEMYTSGYSKKGKYDNKYQTKWQRRAHFAAELKFSQQKAETKAYCKTIRELAGLQTGYTKADLKEGRFIFAKVQRSRDVLKAETVARLTAMSAGIEPTIQEQLFGKTPEQIEALPEIDITHLGKGEVIEPAPDLGLVPDEAPKAPSQSGVLSGILKNYRDGKMITGEVAGSVDKLIEWLDNPAEVHENNSEKWPKAIAILKYLEKVIPPASKIKHKLF